jgi:hypothetical protein
MDFTFLNRYRFTGENKPCVVLGSAPRPQLPNHLRETTTLVCINGSGWSGSRAGWPAPGLTVMTGATITADHTATERKVLSGLATDTLVLINYFPHNHPVSVAQARDIFRTLGFRYRRFVTISRWGRKRMLRRVIGHRIDGPTNDDRPSNGILAICLALSQGAPKVILAGFSFQRSGHHYAPTSGRTRHHQAADQEAVFSLMERGWPLATTEPEMASFFNLELIK